MAALSAAWNRINKATKFVDILVAASTTIYKGAMVMVVKGTGYAVPAADTANGHVMGIALKTVDNSAGSDGDEYVKVQTSDAWIVTLTGVTAADVGKLVYVSNDNTVVKSGQSNDVVAGRVIQVHSTNNAWVRLADPKDFPDQQAHVADAANPTDVAITDNSGGVDPGDDIIAVVTNTDALTNSTGGSSDDTLAAVLQKAGGAGVELTDGDPAIINDNFTEVADQLATQRTANTAILAAVAQLAAKHELGLADRAANKVTIDAILVVLETAGLVATS